MRRGPRAGRERREQNRPATSAARTLTSRTARLVPAPGGPRLDRRRRQPLVGGHGQPRGRARGLLPHPDQLWRNSNRPDDSLPRCGQGWRWIVPDSRSQAPPDSRIRSVDDDLVGVAVQHDDYALAQCEVRRQLRPLREQGEVSIGPPGSRGGAADPRRRRCPPTRFRAARTLDRLPAEPSHRQPRRRARPAPVLHGGGPPRRPPLSSATLVCPWLAATTAAPAAGAAATWRFTWSPASRRPVGARDVDLLVHEK